ncbi:MAG: hypothetical protein NT070_06890 [Cyanobacteria bacterium]|nr:hypothetical protein [Cyanobacteriota bacterium]
MKPQAPASQNGEVRMQGRGAITSRSVLGCDMMAPITDRLKCHDSEPP